MKWYVELGVKELNFLYLLGNFYNNIRFPYNCGELTIHVDVTLQELFVELLKNMKKKKW